MQNKKSVEEMYESPTVSVSDIKAEGVLCQSGLNQNDSADAGYDPFWDLGEI